MPVERAKAMNSSRLTATQAKPMSVKNASIDIRLAAVTLMAWSLLAAVVLSDDQSEPGKASSHSKLSFEEHIAPILQSRCLKCHGKSSRKGGLDLRRRFTMLEGGDSGPALDLKQPKDSLLLGMIAEKEMPPETSPQLTSQEIETIRRWVTDGAKLKGLEELPLAESHDELASRARSFWAFKPPQRPVIPAVKRTDLVRTPIDAFLLAKLETHGATFMPAADKTTLIRRLTFALHGLPPTREQVEKFLADSSPNAYAQLVDELLDSPRYGERWGRHWLDIAGYADSDGYLEADRLRNEAWRYRDYVLRSFNDDKPYDRFLLEQIAGDELNDWRQADELTPETIDNLVATGFMRTSPDPTYPGYIEPPEVHQVIADTVQVFSTGVLGLTLQCARCHEHKMDPFTQRDYYQLWAFFDPAMAAQQWIVSPHRNLPMATDQEAARIKKNNQQADARIKQLQAGIAEATTRFQEKAFRVDMAKISDAALLKKLKAAIRVEPKKRNAEQKKLISDNGVANVNVSTAELSIRFPEFARRMAKHNTAIASETALKETIVQIRGLYDLSGEPKPTRLLKRGDYRTPGVIVQPQLPKALTPAGFQLEIRPGYRTSGRRLALARWLTDSKNPLTARVQVNRVWAQYFSNGIVSTLDNFGSIGARPSHPELLDWLATEFMDKGWRHKALHRLILNSSAFRQSSQPNTKLQTIDPSNKLLGFWPPRRIEGEAIRDAMLSVTGKLNLKMYGKPTPVSRSSKGLVIVANTPEGNRRSVYLIVRRSQPVTLLELFDTPTMETNCTQRTESIVVTQALSMLNSEFTAVTARALADRIIKADPSDDAQRLIALFQLAYARTPTEVERREYAEFLNAVSELSAVAGAPQKAKSPKAKSAKDARAMESRVVDSSGSCRAQQQRVSLRSLISSWSHSSWTATGWTAENSPTCSAGARRFPELAQDSPGWRSRRCLVMTPLWRVSRRTRHRRNGRISSRRRPP